MIKIIPLKNKKSEFMINEEIFQRTITTDPCFKSTRSFVTGDSPKI